MDLFWFVCEEFEEPAGGKGQLGSSIHPVSSVTLTWQSGSNKQHMENWSQCLGFEQSDTLQVKKRAGVCCFLRGGLGDGSQEGAVTFQNGRHEAQEGFLDLQLQHVEALPTAQL